MKLSIWQQFSSNHSADFTSVGQFESAEMASLVADEMREIINTMKWWHDNFSDNDIPSVKLTHLLETDDVPDLIRTSEFISFAVSKIEYPRTIMEQYYKQLYQLSGWKMPLDWIYQGADIQQYQDLLLLTPYSSTWAGSHPIDAILTKLGGKVASEVEGDGGHALGFNIHCKAKSAKEAQTIVEKVQCTLPPKSTTFICIDGLSPAGVWASTRIRVMGKHIELTDYAPSYTRWKPAGGQDYFITVTEILEKLIIFFEENECTNIEYFFSNVQREYEG